MPESFDDPVLGHLFWEAVGGWWVAELDLFPGHPIEVFIDFDEDADEQKIVLDQARTWVERIRQRGEEYRSWTAEQLVDVELEFLEIDEILMLSGVGCASSGSARLYWDDDGLLNHGRRFYTQLDVEGDCVSLDGG